MRVVETFIVMDSMLSFGERIYEICKVYLTETGEYFMEAKNRGTTITKITTEEFIEKSDNMKLSLDSFGRLIN